MIEKIPRLYSISASQFLLCLFEHYHEGVLITDHNGALIYYNKALARLDGLDHQDVLGRSITEIYQLDPYQSMTLTALRLARPIINRPHIYKTVDGKLVNSISSAYPLFDNNVMVGAVCTVTDYSSLMENYSQTEDKTRSRPELLADLGPDVVTFENLIGRDENMLAAIDVARRASATPSSVMLIGETGTGKELFAKAIHHQSHRSKGPFMAVNCAAIPTALLEGILFGTSKGAFTGAVDKAGLFELANGGTLFLDELNSMPIDLQPKLLRVLQDRRVRRIGSSTETPVTVKIVSAVNDSPFEAIEKGDIRADLFYRLGVVMVHLPPLRERRDDLALLLKHFVDKFNLTIGKKVRGFTAEATSLLTGYHWPGNVREMEHAVEAVMNLIDPAEKFIDVFHLKNALPLINFDGRSPRPALSGAQPRLTPPAVSAHEPEDDFAEEAELLIGALRRTRGNVAKAARALGYSPQRLHYRLKKLGIDSADYK